MRKQNLYFIVCCSSIILYFIFGGETTITKTVSNSKGGYTQSSIKQSNNEQYEVNYYENIEDSLMDESLSKSNKDADKITNVQKIIKIIEKNNECLVFYSTRFNNNDTFMIDKLKIKKKDGKTMYSATVMQTGFQWAFNNESKDMVAKDKNLSGDKALEAGVWFDIMMLNPGKGFSVDGIPITFGISANKKILNMKINDKPPTEIIKTEYDNGQVGYLWFYENLNITMENQDNYKITFD